MADDDKDFFPKLEEMGEPTVRAMLKNHEWGTRERQVVRWLELKESERAKEEQALKERGVTADEASAEYAGKAADAAEESAEQAKRAADAAESSADTAKRTLYVAIAAAIFAAASLVAQCASRG